jgi:hypothetical protein
MFVKLFGMVVMAMAMIGVIYMLLMYSWQDERESWDWQHEDIRTNFAPLYTTEEIKQRYKEKREAWLTENPITVPDNREGQAPRANKPANNIEVPFSNNEEPAAAAVASTSAMSTARTPNASGSSPKSCAATRRSCCSMKHRTSLNW